jgi:hypothetical protein
MNRVGFNTLTINRLSIKQRAKRKENETKVKKI